MFASEVAQTARRPAYPWSSPARIIDISPTGRRGRSSARSAGKTLTRVQGETLNLVQTGTITAADPGLLAKVRSKVDDLFRVAENIATASRAKDFQVTVGLPWTATVSLSWDLPKQT